MFAPKVVFCYSYTIRTERWYAYKALIAANSDVLTQKGWDLNTSLRLPAERVFSTGVNYTAM